MQRFHNHIKQHVVEVSLKRILVRVYAHCVQHSTTADCLIFLYKTQFITRATLLIAYNYREKGNNRHTLNVITAWVRQLSEIRVIRYFAFK